MAPLDLRLEPNNYLQGFCWGGLHQGLNVVSGGGFFKIFTTENGSDLLFQESAVNN